MAFDYTATRQAAEAQIANFGQSVTILSQGAKTGSATNPTIGADVPQPTTAVETQFTFQERQGSLVQESDRKFLLSTKGVTNAPTTLDRLLVGGVELAIIAVNPLAPGGVNLLWKVHCRG